jgi:hypothetical protein
MTNEDFKEVLDLVKSKSVEEGDIEYLVNKIKRLEDELLELKGEMIMYDKYGSTEIYPIDNIKFLTKLLKNLTYHDDIMIKEVIENYNNHPNKEYLSKCIEEITYGDIKWGMTVGHDYGFYNGINWLFHNEPSRDSLDCW